ncbi:mediator of RNA polymerase II transcription subunit 15a-like [Jatropha curcas]|uniref:mediator of RNA polymerase II transcription subunit 15a-like n=1 Tax=Jatropha curcas TaxID=180498 RepID=UPI001895A138|nr:mediator of RNA polymerase II transcription subunit 15a-like [Jatropha curcas]
MDSDSLQSVYRTGHANGCDWQEEVYQEVIFMTLTFLPELNEMYQKTLTKIQQVNYLPQLPMPEGLEKLKTFKTMLERMISFLHVSKDNVLPGFKDKLGAYEKQIVKFINANRSRERTSELQSRMGSLSLASS